MKNLFGVSLAAVVLVSSAALPVRADDDKSYTLTIKDHRFEPAQLEVPANAKFKLVIKNMDAAPEEFEMSSPKREKVVKGGGEGTIYLGPFSPGTYDFVGEFNPSTAKGQIVAK
jgi:hypothetical protein